MFVTKINVQLYKAESTSFETTFTRHKSRCGSYPNDIQSLTLLLVCRWVWRDKQSLSRASKKKLVRIVAKRVLELCVPSYTKHTACTRIYNILSVNNIGPQKHAIRVARSWARFKQSESRQIGNVWLNKAFRYPLLDTSTEWRFIWCLHVMLNGSCFNLYCCH